MLEHFVKIRGKTFLYKQKAPFLPSGMSVYGAIEFDPEEDKLRCHECGDWFEYLGVHVVRAHGILARDYKVKHGLRQKSALANEKIRIGHSCTTAKWFSADPERHRKRFLELAFRVGRHGSKLQIHTEGVNERGNCQAQVLERIKQLAGQLGHTPSSAELLAAGMSPSSACSALNVKNLTALASLAHLVPNKRGTSSWYSDVVLIEMLRDFYVFHGRLPRWETDHRRGLLPSRHVFSRAFGGLKKAYRAAGLGIAASREEAETSLQGALV